MKIAFASDNKIQREIFSEYLIDYFNSQHNDIEIQSIYSPEKLLAHASDNSYDIFFFNMEYNGKSGIKYVYRMRSLNPDVEVIVMRFTPEGRVECIITTPNCVVLEDFSKQSCYSMLDIAVGQLNARPERSILLRTTHNIAEIIPITSIVYAEALGHKVIVHLKDEKNIETYGPIKKMGEHLKVYSEFLFPHRSYIVNAFYVSCITNETIYLRATHTAIPVARGKASIVKNAYDEYFKSYNRPLNLSSSI